VKELRKSIAQGMLDIFNRSTRELTESDSGFAPKPGMYTVAQQVAHAAQTIEWFVDGTFSDTGFNLDFEAEDRKVRAVTSLTSARAWMDRAVGALLVAIDQHSDEEWLVPLAPGPIMGGEPRALVLGAINDHTAHHRGALTVYTRLLGKVPPMPYG